MPPASARAGNRNMYLIAGLGNPGKSYEKTRHNAGYMAADELAGLLCLAAPKRAFQSVIGKADYPGGQALICKPETFMNASGVALRAAADYYKIPPEKVIVLCDDIDLPFGTLRLRKTGGPGTHNGLKSVVQHLGRDFLRVRIGVGPPDPRMDLADFVLARFTKEEQDALIEIIPRAAKAALHILTHGIEAAMQAYNITAKE